MIGFLKPLHVKGRLSHRLKARTLSAFGVNVNLNRNWILTDIKELSFILDEVLELCVSQAPIFLRYIFKYLWMK